jgi:hypothetical protein
MADAESGTRSPAGDLAAGAVLFVLSVIGAWSLLADPFIMGEDYGNDPGPGMLPGVLLILLALSSLAMMAIAGAKMVRARRLGTQARAKASWKPLLVPLLLVVTLLAYAGAMTQLGFLESTAVFAIFWTFVIGLQDTARPSVVRLVVWLIEGVVICAVIYVVFAWFIKVPLP